MRIKTFMATYLLFLCILFSSVGIVSVYLNNSQMSMLREKSVSQYQTIAASLTRDIAVLHGRYQEHVSAPLLIDVFEIDGVRSSIYSIYMEPVITWSRFHEAVDTLMRGYSRYYARQNIDISITALHYGGDAHPEVSFVNHEGEHFIDIIGVLRGPFGYFQLDYSLDITENISNMQGIQGALMISAIAFSIIAALALHFILLSIFRPLSIVTKASKKIADGQFDERISIKGKNEIARVAYDFNKMAERIERQITFLEEEAVSKQQFVDNFAHEIRTPLTSIYGYAEYMQKASLDEREIIESAEYIMSEADHMKKIANSLLELATLRNYVPIKTEISVPALFDDISQSLEKPLREHGVHLICNSDNDIIYGQEDLIRSLLLNLCSNALKACSPGEGVIRLDARETRNGITISVTDNGRGIDEENLPKITDPFYRVDKSRSREYGGTGLGLALCRQISEAHGAEMTINSAMGAGTTIEITFTTP